MNKLINEISAGNFFMFTFCWENEFLIGQSTKKFSVNLVKKNIGKSRNFGGLDATNELTITKFKKIHFLWCQIPVLPMYFFSQFVPTMHLICHYIVHKNTYTLINIHGYLDSTVIWHLTVRINKINIITA